jgi:hypothetical protein
VTNFYGNFTIRGIDLVALPCVTEDTAFNVDLEHDGVHALTPGSAVAVQTVLLYTTLLGQRRFVVHTLSRPVTTVLEDLFRKVCACSSSLLCRCRTSSVHASGFACMCRTGRCVCRVQHAVKASTGQNAASRRVCGTCLLAQCGCGHCAGVWTCIGDACYVD